MYTADNWVVIKFNTETPHYKLLVGTSGGYTAGSSWRMNSGIISVTQDKTHLYFTGSSGSVYKLSKQSYGLRMNSAHVWRQLQELHRDKVELMPEETKWLLMDWLLNDLPC
jgi:hypothetical protein